MTATKILLYNSEKDIAVEAYVSAADTGRAKTDMFFATQFLRSVMEKEQEPQVSTSPYHVEHGEDTLFTPIDEETTEIQESKGNTEETHRSTEGILKKGKILKKTYKSTKDYNQKSGNNRKTWQFYELMDEIFGQKAWCDPVAVASSIGLSTKKPETSDSAVGSDSRCSTSELITSNHFTCI
ncbi:hypothetical protein PV325_013464 [Microctonus aethiopoides]|nr:hypothetical protein PV325_013464 [Microctonus aethiopoides]